MLLRKYVTSGVVLMLLRKYVTSWVVLMLLRKYVTRGVVLMLLRKYVTRGVVLMLLRKYVTRGVVLAARTYIVCYHSHFNSNFTCIRMSREVAPSKALVCRLFAGLASVWYTWVVSSSLLKALLTNCWEVIVLLVTSFSSL